MKKVYSVIIKGRTLESRDLKELLARAVAQKRRTDRQFILQNLSRGQASPDNPGGFYYPENQAANL
ncbi:MAG: hypothetical protein QUT30_16670 [Acidobacteriota bacterium]|jgi:hypothetical protein|nr:hypothetical protein [Acidobacteriota bacterium]